MQTERTDLSRMVRWLEHVAEGNPEGFPRLLELCVATQRPWLRDEMHADYLAEKGDLKVEVSGRGGRVGGWGLGEWVRAGWMREGGGFEWMGGWV